MIKGNRKQPSTGTPRVRGLEDRQWEDLERKLHYYRSLVCRAEEEIPFLDFLDMIYEPEAKAHWLANHQMFDGKWVVANSTDLGNTVYTGVKARSDLRQRYVNVHFGGNGGSTYWSPNRPEIGGTRLTRDLILAPLDAPETTNLPERVQVLHRKYGRHIVRCARESAVFAMAMERLKFLFHRAVCARMIRYFFPEIIEHVPDGKYDYWAKTKHNTWSSKYKEEKGNLGWMYRELGDNWETYKKFIMQIIARAVMVESLNKENNKSPVDKWEEKKWYSLDGKPVEEWLVRLTFSP